MVLCRCGHLLHPTLQPLDLLPLHSPHLAPLPLAHHGRPLITVSSIGVGGERKVSPVFLNVRTRATGKGCPGARLARGTAVHFSPPRADPSNSGKDQALRPEGTAGGSSVGLVEIGDSSSTLRRPLAAAATQGSAAAGSGRDLPSQASGPRPVGLARMRENLRISGLPPEVIDTIQAERADSTNTLYNGRWKVFEDWCLDRTPVVVPYQASISDILCFLQSRKDIISWSVLSQS